MLKVFPALFIILLVLIVGSYMQWSFAFSTAVVALSIMVLVAIVGRYMRRKGGPSLSRLQDEWGKPVERWRDLESIAAYHRWRAEEEVGSTYLDDRTWSDLHLDLVFSKVDRTQSTIPANINNSSSASSSFLCLVLIVVPPSCSRARSPSAL